MLRRIAFGIVWLVLVFAPAVSLTAQGGGPPPGEASLAVEIDPGSGTVTVSGAPSGATVTLLGAGRRQVGFLPTTFRYERDVVADANGVAVLEFEDPVPSWSAWVVVDRSSGAFTLAAPEGRRLREIEFPARGLGAARRFLEDERRWLEFWVIRPDLGAGNQLNPEEERGAWGITAGDGGASDSDGVVNAKIRVSMLALYPIGDSPPSPETLAPGDVVVGIDGEDLQVYAVRLASPPGEGTAGGGA